jgi:hypothetical protein
MVQWMNNDTKGIKLCGPNRVELSRIFLWFEDDFGSNCKEWMLQYIQNDEVKKALASPRTGIRYYDYDWNLNRKQN